MSIHLQGIGSIMNRKFTVKDFVTLPPMSKSQPVRHEVLKLDSFFHNQELLFYKNVFCMLKYNP